MCHETSQCFIMLPASFMQMALLWCNVAIYVIKLCVDRVLFSLPNLSFGHQLEGKLKRHMQHAGWRSHNFASKCCHLKPADSIKKCRLYFMAHVGLSELDNYNTVQLSINFTHACREHACVCTLMAYNFVNYCEYFNFARFGSVRSHATVHDNTLEYTLHE